MSNGRVGTSKLLLLNQVRFDWFTVTSEDNHVYNLFADVLDGCGDVREAKRMQYNGRVGYFTDGSLFVGSGTQKNRNHNMIVITSGLAHRLWKLVKTAVREFYAKTTRIDIQITIPDPHKENDGQWKLFNRLKRNGRQVGWVQSMDKDWGELSTIYVGSMKSQRLVRIYMKPAENMNLRFEASFKGYQAKSLGIQLSLGRMKAEEVLIGMVQWCDKNSDDTVLTQFSKAVGSYQPNLPKYEKRATNTERWFTNTVIPSLTRYVNSDDYDPNIIDLFEKAIRR